MVRLRAMIVMAFVGLALTALPSASLAQEAHPTFVAEMSGFEETPGTATLAKGFAGFQLSHDGTSVYYTLTVTDASTKLIAAHLHLAPHGVAGPIVVPLCTDQTTPCETEGVVTSGSFTEAQFTGPFENDKMQRLIDEARDGNVYVNVHTTKFPGGEARGQLVDLGAMLREPEPAEEGDIPAVVED